MPINNDGILVYPVGWGDISRALRVNSLDIGRLCTSPAVNIWAKYKGFDYAALGWDVRTSAGLQARNAALAQRNYGFFNANIASLPCTFDFVPTSNNRFQKYYEETLLDSMGKPLNGWRYYPPSSRYRPMDFHGYRHDAGHPVAFPTLASYGAVSRQYSSTQFQIGLGQLVHDNIVAILGDDGQLSLYDFPDLQNKYFGVLLQGVNDNNRQIFATGNQLTSQVNNVSVWITPYNFPAGWTGLFNIYVFFTATQIPQGLSSEGAVCYPIPGCPIGVVNIVTSYYGASISARKDPVGYGITATYTISNLSNADHVFTVNEMRCRYASVTSWNDQEDGAESAQNKPLGSITVPANSSVTNTVRFYNIDPTLFASCKIWGQFGSTEVPPFGVFPEQRPIPTPVD